jgi:hypothetical protein
MQVALRIYNSQPSLLQAKILRNKITSMYSNVPFAFLLHAAVPFLLESSERRLTDKMGRDETAKLGRT